MDKIATRHGLFPPPFRGGVSGKSAQHHHPPPCPSPAREERTTESQRIPWCCVVALLLALFTPASAQPLLPYTIVGDAIPASLTGKLGDAARGRAIVGNRQVGLCLLCHSGPFPEERFQGNLAPDLAGAGSRSTIGQLRLRIVDASRLNPDTIMPPYYKKDGLVRVASPFRDKPVLTAEQIEDVVAYLATLKD